MYVQDFITKQVITVIVKFPEANFLSLVRFHWEPTDAPILLLRNFVINLLEPQTTLDCAVSEHWLSEFSHTHMCVFQNIWHLVLYFIGNKSGTFWL